MRCLTAGLDSLPGVRHDPARTHGTWNREEGSARRGWPRDEVPGRAGVRLHHHRRRLVTHRPSLPPSCHFTWFRPTPAPSGRRSWFLRPQWARGFLMDTNSTTTGPALFGRVLWMMVGPIPLALLALQIAQQ